MNVIIVAKTHMSNSACVGGVLASGRLVRLLNSKGYNQESDTSLEVGDVYAITFSERKSKRPPHVEDILVDTFEYKFTYSSIQKMVDELTHLLKVKIWNGGPETLFDGSLQWTRSGSGFISESGEIPENSVGFWVSNKPLARHDYEGRVKYQYPPVQKIVFGNRISEWRSIPFVGFQVPVDIIPAGTLVRVSLARWWSPGEDPERCYLQLSGWYGLPEPDDSGSDNENWAPIPA